MDLIPRKIGLTDHHEDVKIDNPTVGNQESSQLVEVVGMEVVNVDEAGILKKAEARSKVEKVEEKTV